jgi:hypothetical protein
MEGVDYKVEGLNDDEMAGLTPRTITDDLGHDETWFLPFDAA